MSKPDFPISIDSTIRSAFVSCQKKFYYEYMLHRRTAQKSIHLIAGGAFAAALESSRIAFWRDGASEDEALAIGACTIIDHFGEDTFEGEAKSRNNMLAALCEYFEHYGWKTDEFRPHLDTAGQPMVEFSFAVPIPGTSHPVTHEPILYTGRFDMIGEHQQTGELYAVDEKTTGSLGQSWINQWRHRGQLTGYVWAGRESGYNLSGACIRGISILKTKFGHAVSMQPRAQFYIDRWLEQLAIDVNNMAQCWLTDQWSYNFAGACTEYGGCGYADVCAHPDPIRWLTTCSDYVHERWDPINHLVVPMDEESPCPT